MSEGLPHKENAEQTVVGAPTVVMRVTDRDGQDINTAKVGDPLALRFEILEYDSPYEIFVRELVAMDGVDTSEILLIDSIGCPTDYSIMGPMKQVNDSAKVLQADFDAFKFPTSGVVQFRGLVTPCIPRCNPVNCEGKDYYGYSRSMSSYGRRRREVEQEEEGIIVEMEGGQEARKKEELLVTSSVQINDKFVFKEEGEGEEDVDVAAMGGEEDDDCGNVFLVAILTTLFLVCQTLLMAGWLYLCRSRTKSSSSDSGDSSSTDSIAPTSLQYHGPSPTHPYFPRGFPHPEMAFSQGPSSLPPPSSFVRQGSTRWDNINNCDVFVIKQRRSSTGSDNSL